VRVALADDAAVLREGLARLLADAGVEVTAQVGTADELLEAIDELQPDVAVVDIRMPPPGATKDSPPSPRSTAATPRSASSSSRNTSRPNTHSSCSTRGASGLGTSSKSACSTSAICSTPSTGSSPARP
jgi:DNA-binding NarL/FixJ family response regulator